MPIELDRVIPWGRSLDEYRRMFALTDQDLRRPILGSADGPASFNAELTEAGGSVVSFDPIYQFTEGELRQRIEKASGEIIEQTKRNSEEFVWSDRLPDVDSLARQRLSTMEKFLRDYEAGRNAARYLVAELPHTPFNGTTFDIAVCSHFLFLYSGQFSEQFHVDSARELIRVAGEVRIFPLIDLAGTPSPHVPRVAEALGKEGYQVEIEVVPYEFQRGAKEMMRITR